MRTWTRRIAIAGLITGSALPIVRAADVGAPLYSTAIGKTANIELYYERFKRDIEQDDWSGHAFTGEQEEDRFIVRANYCASAKAALHAEIGATKSEESEGPVPLLGAGLKIKLYDNPALNVSFLASATYVSKIEYEHKGYVEYDGRVDYRETKQEESYFEIDGGLAVSRLFELDEKTTCTPYGGFMISKLDGDEDYEAKYRLANATIKATGDIKDDGWFAMFAGVGLTLDNVWGIRLEGRFVNQTSFSAGLMYFF